MAYKLLQAAVCSTLLIIGKRWLFLFVTSFTTVRVVTPSDFVKIGENVSPLWTSKGSQGNVSCCGFETVNVVSVLLLYSQLHVNLVACWFDCLFQRRVLAPMNIGNIKAPFLNCDPHTVAVQGDLDVLWKHEFLDFSELPVLETGQGSHHSPGDSLPN